MNTSLVLAFKTTDGKVCNIRVNGPKADITRAQVEAVMNTVIDKDVFETATGARFTGIDSIYTVVTNKSDLLA